MGFNSLRTGRHIQTQFNKSEEVDDVIGFNSLRTGRHIQTEEEEEEEEGGEERFNSLRTGRHIQTLHTPCGCRRDDQKVSIPYEREGTFRHGGHSIWGHGHYQRFNSLRTGRHIQTLERWPSG